MTFSYLRGPDDTERFDRVSARQSKQVAEAGRQSVLDTVNKVKNEEDLGDVFRGLASFSDGIKKLVDYQDKKLTEEAEAKAITDLDSGRLTQDVLREKKEEEEDEDDISRGIQTVNQDLKKAEGDGSLTAQELYNRDSYYKKAARRLLLGDIVSKTPIRIQQAMNDPENGLKIEIDGENLSYNELPDAAARGAWWKAFREKDTKENFVRNGITAKEYAKYGSETYRKTLTEGINRTELVNAKQADADRMTTTKNDIFLASGTSDFPDRIRRTIYSRRMTRDQITTALTTGVQTGQVTGRDLAAMRVEDIDHIDGSGKTSVAKLMGLDNYYKLVKAFDDAEVSEYNRDEKQFKIEERRQMSLIDEAGMNDEDGYSVEQLEQYQEQYKDDNDGRENSLLASRIDEQRRDENAGINYNKEVALYQQQMEYGIFDESILTDPETPSSVKRRLKNYLNQNPQLSPKIASSKHNLNALSDLAYQGLDAVPGQSNHDHIDRMKGVLHAEYNNHILSGLSPDQAIALVTTKFKKNLSEDKKRDEKDRQFVNKHGYVEITNKDKQSVTSVGVTIKQNKRLEKLSSMKDELGNLALGSILPVGEAQKIAKQILIRPGGKPYVFTEYQKQAAAMFGYSHPYSMIKAIIENEPVKEGEEKVMVELPPLVEFADQTFTAAQKALFGNSYKATRRSLAMQDGVPVSSVFKDYSEAEAFSESYGKLSRVITGPEGTSGADGYQKMFGGSTFEGFSDHPRKLNTSNGLTSDAAGKYQFLSTTWDEAAAATGVTDFSPESQEIAARYLIQRAGINPDAPINSKEEFIRVMNALSPVWASLPNTQGKSRYNQPVASHDELWKRYQG